MEKYAFLFGPVPSRRFGRSLGVDLTPYKTCSQDCVFCQLGRTTHKTVTRQEYVPTEAVLSELSEWLKVTGNADYITLSGSGEPTLHSRFGEVLQFIRSQTRIPAVLLTNGAMLHLPEVQSAACHAHIVKVSLSAWDEASYGWINRPHPELSFKHLIEGQRDFRAQFAGELWMEIFLVGGVNSTPADVSKIAALAEEIGPDRIHLNTAVRPPAEDFASPLSKERLVSLVHLFRPTAEVIAEFKPKETVELHADSQMILAMLQRRPCTVDQIAESYGMHINEVAKYLGALMREQQIRAERTHGNVYYLALKEGKQKYAHL